MSDTVTSGHTYKIAKKYSRTDIRKYTFSNRIIESWNALPENVINANSVNSFKNRLDKILNNHPAMYDPDLPL